MYKHAASCDNAIAHVLQKGEDKMYGHAGMLGAAAAVWEDLRANHLLAALLDLPLDEDCKPHTGDHEGDKHDLRMSHSEKERHMQWESEDAHSEDLQTGSEQNPAKHAADVAKARTKGRPRFMERGQLLRTQMFKCRPCSPCCVLTFEVNLCSQQAAWHLSLSRTSAWM